MVIDNPYTDLKEAYKNRARIEEARKKESIRLRVPLELDYPHWPIRVRMPKTAHLFIK